MKPNLLMSFALFSLISTQSVAQTPPPKLDSSLINFFVGDWTGDGHFANGRPIAATLSFHLTLDSAWLVSEHRDRPPGQYKADAYWGPDVAYVFDNFHGHRSFSSSWNAGRLVLATAYEHFIYEKISPTQFRMTYETSRDGTMWRLGDSLLFSRRAGG
jgi:hypothetical protein